MPDRRREGGFQYGRAEAAGQRPEHKPLVSAQKLIWVQVLHGDGSIRDFDLNTAQETLGPALVEGGVVEDNQDGCGLSIRTADGETADGSRQEWWRITKNGELVSTGADAVLIADGDRFELAFQVGYGRS